MGDLYARYLTRSDLCVHRWLSTTTCSPVLPACKMPSAASEAAAKRVDDAVRAKDEDALREAVKEDETKELGSLAVLRCAETGWIEG